MPKAKPISLHPLKFEEAISALVRVNRDKLPKSQGKKQGKRKKDR
jgi:hypothetical protein